MVVVQGSKHVRRIIKFTDKISRLRLKGKSLSAGRKKLTELGLKERRKPSGRHEFLDDKGRVRAAYDPVSQRGGGHWHKFGYDDTGKKVPLNDAGRVVDRESKAAHIPGNSPGKFEPGK